MLPRPFERDSLPHNVQEAEVMSPARMGPKVDTWSKVDVACVKSLRLCLHGVYPQNLLKLPFVFLHLPATGMQGSNSHIFELLVWGSQPVSRLRPLRAELEMQFREVM